MRQQDEDVNNDDLDRDRDSDRQDETSILKLNSRVAGLLRRL